MRGSLKKNNAEFHEITLMNGGVDYAHLSSPKLSHMSTPFSFFSFLFLSHSIIIYQYYITKGIHIFNNYIYMYKKFHFFFFFFLWFRWLDVIGVKKFCVNSGTIK